MSDGTGRVTFKGNPVTLAGRDVAIGEKAPEFELVGADLKPVRLSDFAGKPLIIAAVPSLDTSVCATESRRFNEEAAKLGDAVNILVVSMDLPFAQKRWADEHRATSLRFASDHRQASFGQGYGLLVQDMRLLARAVLVLDKNGRLVYKEVVGEMGNEPDYDKALLAAKAAA